MRLGQTSVVLAASKFAGSIVGFFTTVYFARILGESILGQYALVLSVVSWIGIAGDAGLSKAINKRLSEGSEQSRFLGASITTVGILFFLGGGAILLFATQIDRYVGADVAEFVVLLLFVNLSGIVVSSSLHGTHRVHLTGILSTVERLGRALGQVTLVVFNFGLVGLLLGQALSGLVAHAIGVLYIRIRPALPTQRHVASLFDFAKYAWLGNISNRAYSSLDIIVLGWFVSSGLIGIYSVAWSITIFLNIFGSSLEGTLFPEMSKDATARGTEAVRGLTEDALRYSGVFTIPGLVGSILVGDRLLAIYGSNFTKGASVLAVLVGAGLLYVYLRQLRNTLNAIDRPDLAFRVNGVFTVTNVVLNVGLVAAFGWLGAAVATLSSSLAGAALAYWYVRATVGVELPLGSFGRQWGAAAVMGAVVLVGRRLTENVLTELGAVVVVTLVGSGAAVYLTVLLVIWPEFRTTILDNLPTKRIPG